MKPPDAPALASDRAADPPLLEVVGLSVEFPTQRGTVQAVRDVSFEVRKGETIGIVGESGSGKSVTMQAILGLVDRPGQIVSGDIRWRGASLLRGPKAAALLRTIRGRRMSIVLQDPMTSLDPLFTVGTQITEVLRHHLKMKREAARDRAIELLDLVGVPSPASRLSQYPHELSGGLRQRVLIATALACEPDLLIADEPTTALDVTIQAQVLDLLRSLQERLGISVLLITHDLGVVAGLCHRILVMYAGRIVEAASTRDLYARPRHPYSQALLDSMPRSDVDRQRLLTIEGTPPDLADLPAGCAFEPRCPHRVSRCRTEDPSMTSDPSGRQVACWEPISHSIAQVGLG